MNPGDEWSQVWGLNDIADGEWHHVVGTWDGTDQSIYIDGVLDSTVVRPGIGQINNTVTPLEIGRAESGGVPERYFSGQLDDLAIYSRALSAAEVLALFQDGI